MKVYQVDPIKDPRWSEFIGRHSRASAFHTVAWLKALQQTYGYLPIVFTTTPPNHDLQNGLACCEIKSWLTGGRLVSLPFSDHCEPLFDSHQDLEFLLDSLQPELEPRGWKYVEIRPVLWDFGEMKESKPFVPAASYFLHLLDLGRNTAAVFEGLDKDSVQRRIQHAERAGLREQCGTSEELLKQFYDLFVVTRGRHSVPPVPYTWFQNLIKCKGDSLEIRVACADQTPVAAILTLRFKETLYYKYGCSDVRFKHLGAMPWLLWNAVSAAKRSGALKFDMGRTEESNSGLLTFKNHWVSPSRKLIYWKYPHASFFDSTDGWGTRAAKSIFSYMPPSLLTIAGRLIYRHIG